MATEKPDTTPSDTTQLAKGQPPSKDSAEAAERRRRFVSRPEDIEVEGDTVTI